MKYSEKKLVKFKTRLLKVTANNGNILWKVSIVFGKILIQLFRKSLDNFSLLMNFAKIFDKSNRNVQLRNFKKMNITFFMGNKFLNISSINNFFEKINIFRKNREKPLFEGRAHFLEDRDIFS